MFDAARSWIALTSTVAAICSGWAAWTVATRPTPPTAPTCTPRAEAGAGPAAVEPVRPHAPTPSPTPDSDAFPAHPQIGQSEGLPADGHLHSPTRFPAGPDRIIRSPNNAFATQDTVRHLDAALAAVRHKHPQIHPILVGDLSSEVGGRLAGHVSHRSGRDVDVGFVHKQRVGPGLRIFEDATRENLNLRASFTLLRSLASSHDEPGGMRWGLLDYDVQRILVQWARRNRAASADELDRLFQYPKGAYAPAGLYRHYANHRDHVHVRYGCPVGDEFCRSPPGPPVRHRAGPKSGPRSSSKPARRRR